jgi:hypothetical protein
MAFQMLINSDQNSLETGNQIKSLFDPLESKINGLKNVSKREHISKLGEDYEVSLPESKGQLLKAWSLLEVIPKKDFIDKIRKQNNCIRE